MIANCLSVRVPYNYDDGILHDWLKASIVAQLFNFSRTWLDISLKKGTGGVGVFSDNVDMWVPAEVFLRLNTSILCYIFVI